MLDRYYYRSPSVAAPVGQTFGQWFAANYTPDAWWRLGDSTSTATDEQGTQDGTYVNSPTQGQTGIADADATSFAAASSQYATVADNAAWDIGTSDFSLMFAMKVGTWPSSANEWVFTRGDGYGTHEWGVFLRSGVSGDFRTVINSTTHTISAGSADTAWHLYICAYDRSGNWHLYRDGSEVGSGIDISAQSAVDMTGATQFTIGATSTPQYYLNQTLGEVAFWSGTLLTSSDASAIWDALP